MKQILLILFIFLFLITGCQLFRHSVIKTDTVTVSCEVIHDSIVFINDSSVIRAWFECDSLNHVVMTQFEGENGNNEVGFNNNSLTAKIAVKDSAHIKWVEKHDTTTIYQLIPKEVEKVVYKIPQWLLWLSGLGAGTVIVLIILIILKRK